MIQLPKVSQSCDHNVCGKCLTLRVKCLEQRVFNIGGIEFGECAIRTPKEKLSWPRPSSLKGE